MCPEYLNERDLQSWDFAVKEDPRQIQLNLETYIDVGSIDPMMTVSFDHIPQNRVQCKNAYSHEYAYIYNGKAHLKSVRTYVGDHQRVNRRLGI